jgi:hypothetical protein
MQAVVDEGEPHRGIVVTSVSPGQLMGNQVIADIIWDSQLVVWTIFIILILALVKAMSSWAVSVLR